MASGEIFARIIDAVVSRRDKATVTRISRVSSIPGVRYELFPNITTTTPGLKQTIRVNNLGFRGRDVLQEKPPGTYRIAIVGDSISMDRSLPEKAIFPSLLEKKLNTRPGGPPVEVINASLSGRDTWEELAILRHKVLPLKPDLVILQICLNDHIRLPFPKPLSPIGVFGERAWWGHSVLVDLLDQRSRMFNTAHRYFNFYVLGRRTSQGVLMDNFVDSNIMMDVEPDWEAWSRALLDFHDACRRAGVDDLFVVFPVEYLLRENATETLKSLTDLAAAHGIPLLDLIGPFSRHKPAPLRDYTHPNREGHQIVATEIYRVLDSRIPRTTFPAATDAPSRRTTPKSAAQPYEDRRCFPRMSLQRRSGRSILHYPMSRKTTISWSS